VSGRGPAGGTIIATERAGVRPWRLGPWLIYAGLTIPIGLLAHFVFEQVGGVVRRSGSVESDHALLVAFATAALAAVVWFLRRGSSAERRRRLALVRAALPRGARLFAYGSMVQAVVAVGTLGAEGVSVRPAGLSIAIVAGLVGVLLGSLIFRAVEDDVLAIAAAIGRLAVRSAPFRAASTSLERVLRSPFRARRINAGRAPPFAWSSVR
jgi:hypothetical protein